MYWFSSRHVLEVWMWDWSRWGSFGEKKEDKFDKINLRQIKKKINKKTFLYINQTQNAKESKKKRALIIKVVNTLAGRVWLSVISWDSCMPTNPNTGGRRKKKKRSNKAYIIKCRLRQPTGLEEFGVSGNDVWPWVQTSGECKNCYFWGM